MKKTIFVVIGVLIFLLVMVSFFKLIFPEPSPIRVIYNYYEFNQKAGHWYFEWQSENTIYNIPLRYNPKEVEDVPIEGTLNESFNRPEIYITFNPDDANYTVLALAAGELSLNMVRALKVKPVASCTINSTDACTDQPIVTCENKNKSVILLRDKGSPGILLKGNCVVLLGKNLDLIKSIDRLLYQWYGIMN